MAEHKNVEHGPPVVKPENVASQTHSLAGIRRLQYASSSPRNKGTGQQKENRFSKDQ